MENPQGSTAGIHPITEQFKINRFIFIFLQPDKFQDTTFIPTNQAADLFQRPTLFHTHSHPKTKILHVRIAKELCQCPITGHSHFYCCCDIWHGAGRKNVSMPYNGPLSFLRKGGGNMTTIRNRVSMPYNGPLSFLQCC